MSAKEKWHLTFGNKRVFKHANDAKKEWKRWSFFERNDSEKIERKSNSTITPKNLKKKCSTKNYIFCASKVNHLKNRLCIWLFGFFSKPKNSVFENLGSTNAKVTYQFRAFGMLFGICRKIVHAWSMMVVRRRAGKNLEISKIVLVRLTEEEE